MNQFDSYMPRLYGFQDPRVAGRPPHYEVITVNGKNGVDALQMDANSSILVMDETAPLVWLCKTDGAGYKTAIPYQITPYTPPEPPDVNALMERITKLEEMIADGKKPNAGTAKSSKGSTGSDASN